MTTAHLVQRPPHVNGSVLNNGVHHLRDGRGEVRVGKLGVEEDLWPQEPLVTHVHRETLCGGEGGGGGAVRG